MRSIRVDRWAVAAAFILASAPAGFADDQAAAVLEELRRGLGAPEKLEAVKTLRIKGALSRGAASLRISGEREVVLSFPDKLYRLEALRPMPDMAEGRMISRLNAASAWWGPAPDGPPVQMVGEASAARKAQLLRELQGELRRYGIALLGRLPAGAQVRYAGPAEAPDGRAHALDISDPEGLTTRLFLDAASYRPLMLVYRARPKVVSSTSYRAKADAAGQPQTQLPEAVNDTEMRLYVSEYKEVRGVALPHRIAWGGSDGTIAEEWTTAYDLNPEVDPSLFTEASRR